MYLQLILPALIATIKKRTQTALSSNEMKQKKKKIKTYSFAIYSILASKKQNQNYDPQYKTSDNQQVSNQISAVSVLSFFGTFWLSLIYELVLLWHPFINSPYSSFKLIGLCCIRVLNSKFFVVFVYENLSIFYVCDPMLLICVQIFIENGVCFLAVLLIGRCCHQSSNVILIFGR